MVKVKNKKKNWSDPEERYLPRVFVFLTHFSVCVDVGFAVFDSLSAFLLRWLTRLCGCLSSSLFAPFLSLL